MISAKFNGQTHNKTLRPVILGQPRLSEDDGRVGLGQKICGRMQRAARNSAPHPPFRPISPENHQQIFGINLVSGFHQHFNDFAVALGVKRGFHFHGFDGDQHIARFDFLASLHCKR